MQKGNVRKPMRLLFVVLVMTPVSLMAQSSSASFQHLAERYFNDYYFRFNPTAGTSAGFHQYDTQLEDLSPSARAERIKALQSFRSQLSGVDPKGLSGDERSDLELLRAAIEGDLLEWEQIRGWEKNPDYYSSGISGSAFTIMSRNFAPQDQRLRSLIAREKLMPAALRQGRENLKNPPRIYTEVALEQLPGIVGFFEKDVPSAFDKVKDQSLLSEFRKTNQAVITALKDYETFLKTDVLPRSKGDFRIGAENYRKKLLYNEMVDTPLDRLLEIGMENLRRNREQLKEVAAKIDPKRTPQDVLHDLEKEHPAPSNLLQSFRDTLDGLISFIKARQIITIPSPVKPILEETPPFARALTFASMDTPGPYEKVAKEAFFNVTLPEANWSKSQIEEHMAAFNRGVIVSTAIHEAYPGHYVQFLWIQQPLSKIRKLIGCSSNAEGWAHYTEQMMLDEGYGKGDLKLRLGQLQDALLRNGRYIVGIQMHTGRMTYEQGIEFFQKEALQTKSNAERETKRGTSDPTYLVYTLGKLQIMKLREDYKRQKGSSFRLGEFHDQFMKQGFPPIKIVRRALLGNDSPVL